MLPPPSEQIGWHDSLGPQGSTAGWLVATELTRLQHNKSTVSIIHSEYRLYYSIITASLQAAGFSVPLLLDTGVQSKCFFNGLETTTLFQSVLTGGE